MIVTMDDEYVQNVKTLTQRIVDNRGKEVVFGISRKGGSLELPVRLATPKPRSGTSAASYRESPWLATQPKDWSALSLASITASNMAATQQRIEQDRQLFNERVRAQAQRNRESVAANDPATGASSRRRDSGAAEPMDRRGGGRTRAELNPTPPAFYMTPQAQQAMWKTVEAWGKDFEVRMDRQRQEAVKLWLENAPNVYSTW